MSAADTGGGRFSRLAPRNWSLPLKLTAVLAVPVILALTLGGLRVSDQIHSATDLGALDRYINLQDRVSTLIGQLQRERDQSAVFVGGNRTGDRSVLKNVFDAVDSGRSDTEAAVGDPTNLPGSPQAAFSRVKDALSGLINLRDQVTSFGVDPTATVARYTGLIEPLLVFESSLDRQLNTPELAGSAAGLTALNSAREQVALQHAVVSVAIARGEMLPPDADTVRATDARLGTAIDQFRSGLDTGQQQRLAGWTTSSASTQLQKLKQSALSRISAPGQLGISQADWDAAYQAVLDELRTSESGLRSDIRATSAAHQEKARNAAGVNSVILLLSMLAAAAVVYLTGRSMLKPLRVLRRAALDVADRRLPEAVAAMREGKAPDVTIEPVPVTTREEIGQVARAFDAVHGQAVRLAAEQATLQAGVSSMFINLSRRSQGLVERQLRLIEQLERNEQDSEQLANLFQLDHLATRMRRNSENLLVLAGSDLAKRANQAVPVVDVLRAAVSETEQYQRVVVQTTPEVQVMGRAASDLVHLVAELLDNATSFSPPDTQVVVSSTRTPDGSVLIEIADQGVGMPGEDLISANNRLSGPAEVNVSASRRMGLFVVGRLASRHGIGVRLASSDPNRGASSGVTASVNVPNYLISGALSHTEALEAVKAARPEELGLASYSSPTERTGRGAAANGLAAAGAGAAGATAAAGSTPNGQGAAAPEEQRNPALPSRRPGAAAAAFAPGGAQAAPDGTTATPSRTTGTSQAEPAAAAQAQGATQTPAAAQSAAAQSGQPSGTPAAQSEGGLPRRAAGAALAGPLSSRSAPPSVPSARSAPPATAHREAPADSGQSRGPSIGGPGRVPGGALRSPDGLRSLRTPSGTPSEQDDRQRSDEQVPGARRAYDQPQTPAQTLQQRHRLEDDPAPGTERYEPAGGERSLQVPPIDDRSSPAWHAGEQGQHATHDWGPGHTGEQRTADDRYPEHGGEDSGSGWDQQPDGGAGADSEQGWQPEYAAGSSAQQAWKEEQVLGGAQPMWPGTQEYAAHDALDGYAVDNHAGQDYPGQDHAGQEYAGQDYAAQQPGVQNDAVQNDAVQDYAVQDYGSQDVADQNYGSPDYGSPDYRSRARQAQDEYGQSPIFEEMASAWFRDNWAVAPSEEASGLVPGPEVAAPPLPSGAGDGWESGDGWDSGEPLLQPFTEVAASEYTPVGLPKRRRGAHLIPGAAASSQAKAEPAPAIPVPSRSADQVRNRLGSYQQGVRAGRKHRLEDRISEQAGSHSESDSLHEEMETREQHG